MTLMRPISSWFHSENSLRNSFMPPPFSEGSTATATRMMPMPPIHCVTERQSRRPAGRASTSAKMEPPVVLIPETLSNKLLLKLMPRSANRNGKVPVRLSSTQLKAVAMNSARGGRWPICPRARACSRAARPKQIPALNTKGRQASKDPRLTSNGNSMPLPHMSMTKTPMRNPGLNSFMAPPARAHPAPGAHTHAITPERFQ